MRSKRRRSLAEELMAEEDGGRRRWKTCLHEAGHAVAGHRLLKQTVTAIVFDDGTGAAYLGGDIVPRTYEQALCVSAGPAAEALAELHEVPQVLPPAPPLTTAYPESAAPMVAQLRQSLPDAVVIAQWCIRGVESQPDRWAKRCLWIRRDAGLFVSRYCQEIVSFATGLHSRGIINLPRRHSPPCPS